MNNNSYLSVYPNATSQQDTIAVWNSGANVSRQTFYSPDNSGSHNLTMGIQDSSFNYEGFLYTTDVMKQGVNGVEKMVLYDSTNTTNYYADLLVRQRNTGGGVSNYQTGGVRLENGFSSHIWGICTFDNSNLGFIDGSNTMCYMRSLGNGGSTNTQLNFTGFHRCVVETTLDYLQPGLLVETTGNINNIFYDISNIATKYAPNEIEALPVVKVTTNRNSKKIFGIIGSKEELEDKVFDNCGNLISARRIYNTGGYINNSFDVDVTDINETKFRYNIASLGEGSVRVVLRNEDILPEDGDLIVSSDLIPGYAELQLDNNNLDKDDVIRTKTVGKLTTHWNNTKYETIMVNGFKTKLLGCVIYCG